MFDRLSTSNVGLRRTNYRLLENFMTGYILCKMLFWWRWGIMAAGEKYNEDLEVKIKEKKE